MTGSDGEGTRGAGPPEDPSWIAARRAMVEQQLRARGICDERVLQAMLQVPRHLFVPQPMRPHAYEDRALPIGHGQTISQPFMVARTLELLQLRGRERVLEIGAGSGYQAALLGVLADRVVALERIGPLAERAARVLASLGATNVRVVHADGTGGWPEEAPYDAIAAAAAAEHLPPAWLEQLAPGGRLVAPVGPRHLQHLLLVHRTDDGELRTERFEPCRYVPLLQGTEGDG